MKLRDYITAIESIQKYEGGDIEVGIPYDDGDGQVMWPAAPVVIDAGRPPMPGTIGYRIVAVVHHPEGMSLRDLAKKAKIDYFNGFDVHPDKIPKQPKDETR